MLQVRRDYFAHTFVESALPHRHFGKRESSFFKDTLTIGFLLEFEINRFPTVVYLEVH